MLQRVLCTALSRTGMVDVLRGMLSLCAAACRARQIRGVPVSASDETVTPLRPRRTGQSAPPHSIEAEQATLGSLLIDGGAWEKVCETLDPSDFYRADHQLIYQAIASLARAGQPHDVILVSEELKRLDELERAGGLAYLGALARDTATAENIAAYGEVVHDRAVARDLQRILAGAERAISEGGRTAEIIAAAVGSLGQLRPAREREAVAATLPGIDFSQMQAHLADAHLVKGLFGRQALVSVNGSTGSGKTFVCTDCALHIASGRDWFGHRVFGGLVVYAALEGPRSAENRFVAARDHRGFHAGSPLVLTPGPVSLLDPAAVGALVAFIRQAETTHGEKCVAVFVDTVSRAMGGGDENSSEDMPALIAGADAVRLQIGATVIMAHHLGKDETRGARGHSSYKAALDTEIEVSVQGDVHLATVTKQRDMVSGERLAFRLPVIELGRDEDGDPVTTCYVEPAEAPPSAPLKAGGKHQTALLAALQEWRRTHASDLISSIELRELAKRQSIPRQRFAEVLDALTRIGFLSATVGGFRFTPETR